MVIKVKNIFAAILFCLFLFLGLTGFDQNTGAIPLGGKTCQQGASENGYDIGCTVKDCGSSSSPCCYGCPGISSCVPCGYCGAVQAGGFATCCLVKCPTPTPTPTPIPTPTPDLSKACDDLNQNQCSNSIYCEYYTSKGNILIKGHCGWCYDGQSTYACRCLGDILDHTCTCLDEASCSKDLACTHMKIKEDNTLEPFTGHCLWEYGRCYCREDPTPTPSPSPTVTPSSSTSTFPGGGSLQIAPNQKCGKTKPPVCSGTCEDPDKVCTARFSKKKNKMICKCRKADAEEDNENDEGDE